MSLTSSRSPGSALPSKESGSFTVSTPTSDGSSLIHLQNYTGTLRVSSSGVISVSLPSKFSPTSVATSKKSPLGAPPPGASPFTVAAPAGDTNTSPFTVAPPPQPEHYTTSTTRIGEATFELEEIVGVGEAGGAVATNAATNAAADLITADWGAVEDVPAARPLAKRSRNSAATAIDNGNGSGVGAISRQRGDPLLSTTNLINTNFSQLVLPAGAALEDEGSATLIGSSWVSIDPSCCGAGPSPRWGAASASVDDERIVFYGGEDEHGLVRGDTWSLNIASSHGDAWACRVDDAGATFATPVAMAAAASAAAGGTTTTTSKASGNSNGASPRMWHSLVAVPERNFLVAIGKVEGGAPSSELEIDVFDTSIDLW